MLEARGEITDLDSFHKLWPTAIPSHKWRDRLDAGAAQVQKAAEDALAPSAVIALALNRFGIESTSVIVERVTRWRNPSSAAIHDKRLQETLAETLDVEDVIPSLRNLRACYVDAIGTLGITTCRMAALAACRLAVWELAASRPPDSYDAFRTGFEAVVEAEKSVLDPHLTDSHLREVMAFHCIATEQPFRHSGPIPR